MTGRSGRLEVMYRTMGKRAVDVVLASAALVVLSPVIGVVGVMVRVKLGSPVLFRQVRPGLRGRVFEMYKFRTMTSERDESGEMLPDSVRLTPFGQWLRSTSLDELPELVNIVKGDMSIVGPRPLLVEYLGLYDERQARRHEVRPGLTGLAQVRGRNLLSWEEKFEADVEYVDRVSFRLDAWIVARTVINVLRRDGIAAQGTSTAHPFLGGDARTVQQPRKGCVGQAESPHIATGRFGGVL